MIPRIYIYIIGGISICSCYVLREFQSLMEKLASGANPKIIVCDFNAWTEEWGSRETDTRIRELLQPFSVLSAFFVQENTGCVDTFRGEIRSMIYVTFVSDSKDSKDLRWHRSESYTHSDDQDIIFEIKQLTKINWSRKTVVKWAVNRFDEERLKEVLLQNTKLEGNTNDKASEIGGKIR